jgi:hypothetical protein
MIQLRPLANHSWQSTVLAAVAGFLTPGLEEIVGRNGYGHRDHLPGRRRTPLIRFLYTIACVPHRLVREFHASFQTPPRGEALGLRYYFT